MAHRSSRIVSVSFVGNCRIWPSEYEALLSTQQAIAFGDASYLSLVIVMPHWCVVQKHRKSGVSGMFVPSVLDAAGRLGPGCCDVSVQAVENRARLCGKYHHLQFIFRGKLFDTEVSTCLTSPLTG